MKCEVCHRSADEVELYDGVMSDRIVKICSECAEKESVPLLKKPTENQLERADRFYSVRERMEVLSGMRDVTPVSDEQMGVQQTLAKLRFPARQRQRHPDAVDNYFWVVEMSRRRRKLSHKQLSEISGVEEGKIKMIERGILPEDFHQIFLRLEDALDVRLLRNRPVLKEEKNDEEILEEVRRKMEGSGDKKDKLEEIESGSFDFSDRKSLENITIYDLWKIKQKKKEKEGLVGDDLEVD